MPVSRLFYDNKNGTRQNRSWVTLNQSKIGVTLYQSKIGVALYQSKIGVTLYQSKIVVTLYQSKIGVTLYQSKIGLMLYQSKIGVTLHQSKIGVTLYQSRLKRIDYRESVEPAELGLEGGQATVDQSQLQQGVVKRGCGARPEEGHRVVGHVQVLQLGQRVERGRPVANGRPGEV